VCFSSHCECPGFRIERFLQPCLLLCLAIRSSHGYELMERLKHFLLEDESPDPGLVYRTLRKMEEDGWVSSEWVTETSGPAKRIYTLTGEGKTVLRLWVEHVRRQVLRLQRFLEEYEKFQRESEHHG